MLVEKTHMEEDLLHRKNKCVILAGFSVLKQHKVC